MMAVLMLAVAAVAAPEGAELPPAGLPSLAAAVRIDGPLSFCGEPVPLDEQEVRERLEKEMLLSLWDRPQVILWIKRSGRYFPAIETMLRSGQVPQDLKYVAVAESALRPHARSARGAVGFWQFMRGTGRKHGLRIDRHLDERRNVFKSTRAAVAYFRELHGQFGSWTLAAAAFNMGETGLQAEIAEQQVEDYYHLYLPIETQRFVFRILAIKRILSDPGRYGFTLQEADLYPPLAVEQVALTLTAEAPLRLAAAAAGTHFKALKDLNPEIRGHYLPEGDHVLAVPAGASGDFHERFARLHLQWLQGDPKKIYVVVEGDNLSLIAERFGVTLLSLLRWNDLDPRTPIYPGQRLVVYPPEAR